MQEAMTKFVAPPRTSTHQSHEQHLAGPLGVNRGRSPAMVDKADSFQTSRVSASESNHNHDVGSEPASSEIARWLLKCCSESHATELFTYSAQDFFLMSRTWLRDTLLTQFPQSRLGGVIFDNWLTELPLRSNKTSSVISVDVTETLLAIHMPHGSSDKDSHGSIASAHNRDVHRGPVLGNFICGTTITTMEYTVPSSTSPQAPAQQAASWASPSDSEPGARYPRHEGNVSLVRRPHPTDQNDLDRRCYYTGPVLDLQPESRWRLGRGASQQPPSRRGSVPVLYLTLLFFFCLLKSFTLYLIVCKNI